ncbi:MAG: hypothetical protein U1F83_09610 [Verrucomicrobiota bacterium]
MNQSAIHVRSALARLVCASALLGVALSTPAAVEVAIGFNENNQATPAFKFTNVPAPSKADAATTAKFSIAAGERDENGGFIKALNDGRLPSESDEPGANFFFAGGGPAGRLVADLGKVIELKAVNSYSWHTDGRAPQVYKLYASDGDRAGFNPKPDRSVDLDQGGWKLVAAIDTRTKFAGQGRPVWRQYYRPCRRDWEMPLSALRRCHDGFERPLRADIFQRD